jgi:hypothetical protein
MLRICDHSECATLTLGRFCVQHEPPAERERFPRGRPFNQLPPTLVDDDLRGDAFPSALLTNAAADTAELEPIRAVSWEGGS